jgi:hypothetical protein
MLDSDEDNRFRFVSNEGEDSELEYSGLFYYSKMIELLLSTKRLNYDHHIVVCILSLCCCVFNLVYYDTVDY